MTENQWAQTSEPYPADPYGTGDATEPATRQSGSSTKTDAVKDEAANVAGRAGGAAQNVAETAKSEAANVASEVKDQRQGPSAPGEVRPDQPGRHPAAESRGRNPDRLLAAAFHGRRAGPAGRRLGPHPPGRRPIRIGCVLAGQPGPGLAAGRGQVFRPPATGHLPAPRRRSRFARWPSRPQPAGRSTRNWNHDRHPRPVPCRSTPVQPPRLLPTTYAETVYGEPARPGFESHGSAGVPLRDPDDPYVEGGGRPL